MPRGARPASPILMNAHPGPAAPGPGGFAPGRPRPRAACLGRNRAGGVAPSPGGRLAESLPDPIPLMKPLCPAVLLASLLGAQSAQELRDQRDGKLQLPFLAAVPWERSLADALAKARKLERFVFVYLTRSDQKCMGSLSIEAGVLREAGFAELCQRVVPLCHIHSRVPGDPDPGLARRLTGVEKFPQMLFLDAKGKIVYRVRGEKLADVRLGLSELQAEQDLIQRAARKEKGAARALLKKQLQLQHVAFPEARRRLRKLRLDKAGKAEFEPLIFAAEIRHLDASARDEKSARKAGEKVWRFHKSGRLPPPGVILPYWRLLMTWAEYRKQAALYEEGLDTLRQEFPRMDFSAEDAILKRLQSDR